MVPDLVNGVIEPPQRVSEPLTGRLGGHVDRGLQVQADMEDAVNHPVKQVVSVACLPGGQRPRPGW